MPNSTDILLEIPNISNCWKYPCTKCVQAKTNEDEACPLKHFLEDKSDEYFESYLIPDDVLLKYWSVFDIVTDNSCNSCCFTKAYHRYAQGTGSVILAVKEAEADDIFDRVRKSEDTQVQLTLLKKLKLRYFTPKEIANIMCFPNSFGFPSSVTVRQMYKSLGNSLNVFVVSCLMKLMLDKPD
ncbi:hypothetical protein CDAR_228681 [Caerostris darwini]|uniref:tRNA (cytosine(38)-C(5))-methyltransferase n=1 Tax=Caerostris darwini TaxID=1538125 RepID=A0AAV4N3N8_9ARAC|nr:hypothetical protein CDAR_228681 [Caerostris darwini]